MIVKIKKLSESAVIPKYAKRGDAAIDLVATRVISSTNEMITYGTDLALEIPEGFVGLVFPRSSIRDTNLSLSNSVGVIDSGYRGEIMASFKVVNRMPFHTKVYGVGDRIAQLMILPYPKMIFEEVDVLSETERGVGGFGHTGN